MAKTYKGKYKIKDRAKYVGNPDEVTYRSHWERQAFRWCEANTSIKKWGSEVVVIPYKSAVDGNVHRYYMDLYIEFINGRKVLVEIKPDSQTKPPKQPKRKTKKYLNEVTTYITNECKWKAAGSFAKARGMDFEIWTEHTLKSLGIKLLSG